MAYEIIYTSSPRGLSPGKSGFCTVAATENIPKPLWEKLESLTAYREIFSPTDARFAENPVKWQYFPLGAGGKNYGVISRISAVPKDFSGRTNKFAHLIALTPDEFFPAGPASVLSIPRLMQITFNDEPQYLPPKIISSPPPPTAKHWAKFNEQNYAKMIAEHLATGDSVAIKFSPDTDLLPLIAEVWNEIPQAQRWRFGFSSYFTELLAGIDCRLHGLPIGLETLANEKLIFDLTNPASFPNLKLSASAAATKNKLAPILDLSRRQARASSADRASAKINRQDDDYLSASQIREIERNRFLKIVLIFGILLIVAATIAIVKFSSFLSPTETEISTAPDENFVAEKSAQKPNGNPANNRVSASDKTAPNPEKNKSTQAENKSVVQDVQNVAAEKSIDERDGQIASTDSGESSNSNADTAEPTNTETEATMKEENGENFTPPSTVESGENTSSSAPKHSDQTEDASQKSNENSATKPTSANNEDEQKEIAFGKEITAAEELIAKHESQIQPIIVEHLHSLTHRLENEITHQEGIKADAVNDRKLKNEIKIKIKNEADGFIKKLESKKEELTLLTNEEADTPPNLRAIGILKITEETFGVLKRANIGEYNRYSRFKNNVDELLKTLGDDADNEIADLNKIKKENLEPLTEKLKSSDKNLYEDHAEKINRLNSRVENLINDWQKISAAAKPQNK